VALDPAPLRTGELGSHELPHRDLFIGQGVHHVEDRAENRPLKRPTEVAGHDRITKGVHEQPCLDIQDLPFGSAVPVLEDPGRAGNPPVTGGRRQPNKCISGRVKRDHEDGAGERFVESPVPRKELELSCFDCIRRIKLQTTRTHKDELHRPIADRLGGDKHAFVQMDNGEPGPKAEARHPDRGFLVGSCRPDLPEKFLGRRRRRAVTHRERKQARRRYHHDLGTAEQQHRSPRLNPGGPLGVPPLLR